MTVLPITVLPHDVDVLRAKAVRIRKIDGSTHALVEHMIDSMHAANGVGLAAPQIGVSLRVVVIGIPGERPFALINPQVVRTIGERSVIEGCLSVPGYRAEITRSSRVVIKALDLRGREVRIRAEDDLLAQALEHEINHVNGIIYIDHIQSPDKLQRMGDEIEPDAGSDDFTDQIDVPTSD
jgi:peptide deformylase